MRRLRTSRTCRAAENPNPGIHLVDSNAAQVDAFVVTVFMSAVDTNNGEVDAFAGRPTMLLADSNATPTDADAVDVEIRALLADLNATPASLFQTTTQIALNDSSNTPSDAISASATFPINDSNATPTETIAVTTKVAIADENNDQNDFISVGNNFGISDHNSAQTDALLVRISMSLADSNAAPTDIPNYFKADLTDSNATETDVLLAKLKASIVDSNATPADSLTVKLKTVLADSNADPADALTTKLTTSISESNATQTDSVVAKVKPVIADSNSNQTDSLNATIPFTWPPAGSIMAWRADLGVTLNGGNVSVWVDQISGVHATQATPANQPPFVADEGAGFNHRPGIEFLTAAQALQILLNPAVNLPFTMLAVVRSTLGGSSIAKVTDNNNHIRMQYTDILPGPTNGTAVIASPASGLTQISINGSLPGAIAAFVGGNIPLGIVSKLFLNAKTPVKTQANLMTDGAIPATSPQWFIGNDVFTGRNLDGPVLELIIGDSTVDIAAWYDYVFNHYGITIGP